jgi:hypothetical protein
LKDHLLGLTGLRPWRCRTCEARFYGWTTPVAFAGYAHCRRCGNLDLQQVARHHVNEGALARVGRWLHLPAYRCAPCRHCFFSLRAYRRIVSSDYPPTTDESGSPGKSVPLCS